MPLNEIIQILLVTIISGLGYWLSRVAKDIKDLEDRIIGCQTSLPKDYLLKDDYHNDIKDMKKELREQSKKIDQIWKTLREEK